MVVFRANLNAESQGRLQVTRLYESADDGVKDMFSFLIARDTMHQNQWMTAIEELEQHRCRSFYVPKEKYDSEPQPMGQIPALNPAPSYVHNTPPMRVREENQPACCIGL
ncbi:Mn-containing catalase [Alteribacillus bidgolensis]|uniref:Mn-containing catalase n=1 Tax=Alteribacillus bidgolensis TaxID=930129 RepID=A0A1G8ICC3_9BACI|nr:Mn-containing catalase [Alteribacillus bidgolensis]